MTSVAAALPAATMASLAESGGWGEFEKNSLLGRGGFGRVVASMNPVTFSPCAIKIGIDPKHNAQIPREYEILSGPLRNAPHTIRVKGLLCSAEKAALAMERLMGRDLYDLVKKKPEKMTFPVFSKIAIQWLEALAFYRKQGVVHGDGKPENCFYDLAKNELTIFDFGIAFFPGREKWGGLYTLECMALEKLVSAFASYESDMWELGVALFYVYTGRRMFLGPGGKKCEHKHELAWSFEQQFKEPFIAYVGREDLERSNPRCFDEVPELEQEQQCLRHGREVIDQYVGKVAPCAPSAPWRELIYEAAASKGESHYAQQIIHFLEQIFVVPHERITPQEGIEYFASMNEDIGADAAALLPLLCGDGSPHVSTWPGAERNSQPRSFYHSAPTQCEPCLDSFVLGGKEEKAVASRCRSLLSSSHDPAPVKSDLVLLRLLHESNS